MNWTKKHFHPLYRALFLDVLFNRRTRPIFIYAVIIIGIGAALYHWLEGWNWLDSVYFVVITLTTVGYGDLHPTTPATKMITIFYGLNGIILILMLFDVVRKLRGWDIDDATKELKEREQEQEKNDASRPLLFQQNLSGKEYFQVTPKRFDDDTRPI